MIIRIRATLLLFGFCLALVSLPQAQTITSINPTSGVAGTQVTITGTSLACPSGWSCSLSLSNNIVSWTNTTIVAIVPLGLPANTTTVPVFTSYMGRWEGEDAQSNTVYFTLLQPLITSISPTTVRPGTQVTMNGSGFGATQGSSAVTFNGITTPVVSWSDSQIVVTVPSGATSGAITISVQGLSPVTSPHLEVWPYIASITPSSGGVGTELEIHGEGLNLVGLVHCLSVNGWPTAETYWSDTLIRLKIRPGSIPATATSVPISIDYWFDDDWGGGYLDRSSNTYNFTIAQAPITSLVPATGRPTDIVTINGSNFGVVQGQSVVTFGSVAAQVNSWSDSQIRAVVPEGVPDGYVFVKVPGLGAGASWFSLLPWIKSTEPAVAVPNTLLTIQGQGLLPGAFNLQGLRINGTPVSTESWADSQIIVRVPNLPPGTVSIGVSADYTYCDDYDGCLYGETSNTIQVPVAQALPSSVILTTSSTPASFGSTVVLTAVVIPSSATGTVTFMDGSSTLGSATVVAGVATYTTSPFAVGTHSITAVYSGDLTYTPSTSASLTQTVNKATSSVVLTSSLNPSLFGQAVTLTATATAGATGTVTFQNAGVTLGTVELSGNVALYTTSALSVGSHQLTAVYSGDSSFDTNTSAVLTQIVNNPIQILGLSPNSGAPGTTVTITGSGFGSTMPANAAVLLGSVALPILDWSDTAIRVSIPGTATSGTVSVQIGPYVLSAGTFTVTSASSNAVLKLRVDDTPGTVTVSDAQDWVIWGADGQTPTSTRKAGVTPLISDATPLDPTDVDADTYGYIRYSWSNGTPIENGTDVRAEIYNTGFQITVPATTNVQTLKVYAGIYTNAVITATLSDNSSAPVTASLGATTELDKTFTIDFRGATDNQTLTVAIAATDDVVALQAATLGPHVPDIEITDPVNQQSFTWPTNLTAELFAQQFDAQIASVQLNADGASLFTMDTPPYAATWSGVTPGHHRLTATATDANGLVGTAKAVEFDVIQTGGRLSVSLGQVESLIDLTAEGTADWVLFGHPDPLTNAEPRKVGVSPAITTTLLGNHLPSLWWCCAANDFTFVDGTPIPTSRMIGYLPTDWLGVRPASEVDGIGSGYEITVPAGTEERTLKLYAGTSFARANLTAFLSDGSAPVIVNQSLDELDQESDTVYTITYAAATENQHLTVRFILADAYWGDILLHAATLSGPPLETTAQVTSVVPGFGAPGEQISIYGGGFGNLQGMSAVLVNGTVAQVNTWSDNRIDFVVPNVSCSGPISLSLTGLQLGPIDFTVALPITISPSTYILQVGGSIAYTAHTSGCDVPVEDAHWGWGASPWSPPSAILSGAWPTRTAHPVLTAQAPGMATVSASLGNYFAYSSVTIVPTFAQPHIESLQPRTGLVGESVTIIGSGFSSWQIETTVFFNGIAATVTEWTPTEIHAIVPAGAFSGPVTVNVAGVTSNEVPFELAASSPILNSISPTAGGIGTIVTFRGARFGNSQGPSIVSFNGVPAQVISWSDNSVLAAVPPGATTGPATVNVAGFPSGPLDFTVVLGNRLQAPSGLVVPDMASLLVGETQGLDFVDPSGNRILGAQWSIDNNTLAQLSTDDPPVLTAKEPGHVILTATFAGGTASSEFDIYAGKVLPSGTSRWAVFPITAGSAFTNSVQAMNSTGIGPDVYAAEQVGSTYRVHALAADGRFKWQKDVDGQGCPLSASESDLVGANSGGLLIVARNSSCNHRLILLNPADGSERWRYTSENGSLTKLAVAGAGNVYFVDKERYGAGPAKLVGISEASGNQVTTYDLSPSSWNHAFAADFHNDEQYPDCVEGANLSWNLDRPYDLTVGDPIATSDGSIHVTYTRSRRTITLQNCVVSIQQYQSGTTVRTYLGSGTLDHQAYRYLVTLTPGGAQASVLQQDTFTGPIDWKTSHDQYIPQVVSLRNRYGPFIPYFSPGILVPDGSGGLLSVFGKAATSAVPAGLSQKPSIQVVERLNAGTPLYAVESQPNDSFGPLKAVLGDDSALYWGDSMYLNSTRISDGFLNWTRRSGALFGSFDLKSAQDGGGVILDDALLTDSRLLKIDSGGIATSFYKGVGKSSKLDHWVGANWFGIGQSFAEFALTFTATLARDAVSARPRSTGNRWNQYSGPGITIAHFLPIYFSTIPAEYPLLSYQNDILADTDPGLTHNRWYWRGNANVESFLGELNKARSKPNDIVAFFGHGFRSPFTNQSVGLCFADNTPGADCLEAIPLPGDPEYDGLGLLPPEGYEVVKFVDSDLLDGDTKVILIAACDVGPKFLDLWSRYTQKPGRALIVAPNNEVNLKDTAKPFWLRLLKLLSDGYSVSDAVHDADTTNYGWTVIGDQNVKLQ